jgi:hypothetical protein
VLPVPRFDGHPDDISARKPGPMATINSGDTPSSKMTRHPNVLYGRVLGLYEADAMEEDFFRGAATSPDSRFQQATVRAAAEPPSRWAARQARAEGE